MKLENDYIILKSLYVFFISTIIHGFAEFKKLYGHYSYVELDEKYSTVSHIKSPKLVNGCK